MRKPNEERQERSKEDLEIIYQMLHKKYNDKGINLPSLKELKEREATPRRGRVPQKKAA